ncbi:unnamed protein product [Calypogeia fissa]
METPFYPHPGDIILLQTPVRYADGTFGPLVKIYQDNFFFAAGNSFMMSRPPKHIFKRGERILRLFKLYQNWEFVTCKTHKLYLHYPGFDKEKSWHLVNTITNKDHLSNPSEAPKLPLVTNFTHIPPSKLFSSLPKNAFTPRLRDIIIHVVPIVENKPSTEKCLTCKKWEHDALYWSQDVNNPVSVPSASDLGPIGEGCYNCRVPGSDSKLKANATSWAKWWELEFWSEKFQPQVGDVLVRYDIDTQYLGQFKKSHLQVELFVYVAAEKTWKYLGMDVAQFGPLIQIHDIVYRPQPGDIIISKTQRWSVRWDPTRHSGGWAMFYKDVSHFGITEGGQNLWNADGEENKATAKKTPTDCWVVRLGFFDEYWDYHLNDRADVFAMHPNGETMLLHYSTDYPYVGQPPQYIFEIDKQDPLLMAEVELEPNHWDLVVRRVERVHEDPLKTRDWKPDPHHWMRDPTLWGRDVPPRFDKEVELFTYWSGFVFEDKDFLLRAGFDSIDENEIRDFNEDFFVPDSPQDSRSGGSFGPPNPSIPSFHTNASVELYQVVVDEENPPKFLFFGRDQFSFPDEYAPETIDYVEDDSPPSEKPKKKVVESKDTSKGKKIKEASKEGVGNEKHQVQTEVSMIKPHESDNNVDSGAAKALKLSGGDEVALP